MASSCGAGPQGVICHILGSVIGLPSQAGGAVRGAIGSAANSAFNEIANAMASAAAGLLKTLSTFWMNIRTPQLSGPATPIAVIQADTSWIVTSVAVVCILIAAGRMAIRRRGEPVGVMTLGLARLVVVSAAATFLVETAGKLGDTFSADLMNAAHLGSNGWARVIDVTAMSAAIAPGPGFLLIIAVLIVFAALIQLLLMILRIGLLIILTGTLPLAAAASMSDWGESWWRKHLGWLCAWLLYKPAAALLYSAAFGLTQGKRTAVEVLAGFMLLVLSILILPALLRVIVPMTASLGAASAGSLAMGAAGAVATGAIRLPRPATGAGAEVGAAQSAPAAIGPGAGGDGAGGRGQGGPPSGSPSDHSERDSAPPSDSGGSPHRPDDNTAEQGGGTETGPGPDEQTPPAPTGSGGAPDDQAGGNPDGPAADAQGPEARGDRKDDPSGAVDANDNSHENGGHDA